jgi:hypothetical protein
MDTITVSMRLAEKRRPRRKKLNALSFEIGVDGHTSYKYSKAEWTSPMTISLARLTECPHNQQQGHAKAESLE